jgi:hypothetical protein
MVEFPSMRFRHLGINHLKGFAKEFLRSLELEKKFILPWFATHDVLISEPIKLNTYEQYKEEHVITDLDLALKIIKQKYPHMYDFAIENLNSQEGFYPTNMFITRREILTQYGDWLFSILLPLYNEIKEDLQTRGTEQKLALAYLSERLFTIYFRYQQKYKGMRIKEFPFALASDFFNPPPNSEFIKIITSSWEDIFIKQGQNKICGYNNPDFFCGKFEILPNSKIKIRWDNGKTSYIRQLQNNTFKLEK